MNRNTLIEYLKNVMYLEQTCYEEERVLNYLSNQKNAYYNPKLQKEEEENYIDSLWTIVGCELEDEFGLAVTAVTAVLAIIFWIIYFVKAHGTDNGTNDKYIYIIISICIIMFGILLVFSKANDKLKEQKQKNKRIRNNNEKIREKNKSFKNECTRIAKRLSMEYDYLEKQYNSTYDLLNSYYAKGIIYYKYRDIACVASILEYIESGRANDLPTAYNLLEQDIKYNNVITKLDIIIDKLNDISMNQYYLYDSISQANKNINTLNSNILSSAKRISSQLDRQNDNLESIRYVQAKDSRNLQLIKDLTFYNTFY